MFPLFILLVGMVTVVVLIMVLRLHAFFALLAAALVVSLLSPGEVADKVTRVATAFARPTHCGFGQAVRVRSAQGFPI